MLSTLPKRRIAFATHDTTTNNMKLLFLLFGLFFSTAAFAQTNNPDLEKLVQLGELYAANPNARGKEFKNAAERLRTPALDPVIDVLIAMGKADKKLLEKQFLSKPSPQVLRYWYALEEIEHNSSADQIDRQSNLAVAKNALVASVDNRWLLHNYYSNLHVGLAMLFNDKNLSQYNLDLNNYGLANTTEKAICFINITHAFTQRFLVLQMMKNDKGLLNYTQKMPAFNGNPYYHYRAFDFEDFDFLDAQDQVQSYKKYCLGTLYSTLNAHSEALVESEKQNELKKLYRNSILFQPTYFPYAGLLEKDLKQLYEQAKT